MYAKISKLYNKSEISKHLWAILRLNQRCLITLSSIKTKKCNEPIKWFNNLLHPRHSSQSRDTVSSVTHFDSKDRWPSNPATFTSGFNWIPEISRQPIIFRNCSISTFHRHMKLNTSAKFHDFLRPIIFNFPPSDLMHPRYCRSADARTRMQIALLLNALIQERYLIKCNQKRTKPSLGWLPDQLGEKGLVSGRSPVRTPAWPTLRVFKFQTEKKVLPF